MIGLYFSPANRQAFHASSWLEAPVGPMAPMSRGSRRLLPVMPTSRRSSRQRPEPKAEGREPAEEDDEVADERRVAKEAQREEEHELKDDDRN